MNDPVTPLVPPGSTVLRELALAVDQTLRLPEPWPRDLDEEIFLRLSRDRADLVCQATSRIISNHQPGYVMTVTAWLRERAAALPADTYKHARRLA